MNSNLKPTLDKKRKHATRIMFLAVVWNVVAGCTALSPQEDDEVLEMKSEIVRLALPVQDRGIGWIDHERVLFEGWERATKDVGKARPAAERGLYIWNIRTKEVIRYTKEPLWGPICFADGYVNYVVTIEDRNTHLEGVLGQEKSAGSKASKVNIGRVNRFTCRSYDPASLPKPRIGGGIEPLRPEHGWLEQTGNATWFRGRDDKLSLLSHDGRPMGPVRPQKFSPVVNKYVFWRPSDNKTWLITARGTTELQALPSGLVPPGSLEPFAGGLLLRSTQINAEANWDPGASGLYIYPVSTNPRRLVSGLVHALQVHAEGCLVAVIVDPWNSRRRELELKAFNACGQASHVGK